MSKENGLTVASGERPSYQRIRNWLWGYDFFISYHWGSGGTYAVNLAARLRDRGYEVFLDRSEYAMGDDWKKVGEAALKNTQRLVLVATTEAVFESGPVEREVVLFTQRRRQIIPIFFGDTFAAEEAAHPDKHKVLTLLPDATLYIEDSEQSLDDQLPPNHVIEKLVATHGIMRRRVLRQLITIIALVLLATLAVAAFISAIAANSAYTSEVAARQEEEKAKEKAIWQLGTNLVSQGELLISKSDYKKAYGTFDEALSQFREVDACPFLGLQGLADLNQRFLTPKNVINLEHPITCCVMAPNETFAVVGQQDRLRIVGFDNFKTKQFVSLSPVHSSTIKQIAISEQGDLVASADSDGNVWLQKLGSDEKPLKTGIQPDTGVSKLEFDSEGRRLFIFADEVSSIDTRTGEQLPPVDSPFSGSKIGKVEYLTAINGAKVSVIEMPSQKITELKNDSAIAIVDAAVSFPLCYIFDRKGNLTTWNIQSTTKVGSWKLPQIKGLVSGGHYSVPNAKIDIEGNVLTWGGRYHYGQFGMVTKELIGQTQLSTGNELALLEGVETGNLEIALRANRYFVSSTKNQLILWHYALPRHITRFLFDEGNDLLTTSDDKKMIVNEENKKLTIVNLMDKSENYLPIPDFIQAEASNWARNSLFVSFTSNPNEILLGYDRQFGILSVDDGDFRLVGETSNSGVDFVFSKDKGIVSVICQDKTVEVWDIASSKRLRKFLTEGDEFGKTSSNDGAENQLVHLEMSNDSERLAICQLGSLMLYDLRKGKMIKKFVGDSNEIFLVSFFDAERKLLLVGERTSGRLYLVDSNTGERLSSLGIHKGINCINVSTDGRIGLSGSGSIFPLNGRSENCHLTYWDLETGNQLRSTEFPKPIKSVFAHNDWLLVNFSTQRSEPQRIHQSELWNYSKVNQERVIRKNLLDKIRRN